MSKSNGTNNSSFVLSENEINTQKILTEIDGKNQYSDNTIDSLLEKLSSESVELSSIALSKQEKTDDLRNVIDGFNKNSKAKLIIPIRTEDGRFTTLILTKKNNKTAASATYIDLRGTEKTASPSFIEWISGAKKDTASKVTEIGSLPIHIRNILTTTSVAVPKDITFTTNKIQQPTDNIGEPFLVEILKKLATGQMTVRNDRLYEKDKNSKYNNFKDLTPEKSEAAEKLSRQKAAEQLAQDNPELSSKRIQQRTSKESNREASFSMPQMIRTTVAAALLRSASGSQSFPDSGSQSNEGLLTSNSGIFPAVQAPLFGSALKSKYLRGSISQSNEGSLSLDSANNIEIQAFSPPTRRPTTNPPSLKPTSKSTIVPTASTTKDSPISNQPSNQPTFKPNAQPSAEPILQPVNQPIAQPSLQPSNQPTFKPNAQPSAEPILQPVNQPIAQPSLQPSNQPTFKPNAQPSAGPILQPTNQPNAQPSLQPSNQPTFKPNAQPSAGPILQPVNQPIAQPSLQPSNQPTFKPNGQPSLYPSAQPSAGPILQPVNQPNAQPSLQPSNPPTVKPNAQPSLYPSAQPSAGPILQPVNQPNAQPSLQPSNRSTGKPIIQPSLNPTEQSSIRTSLQPSRNPSSKPSNQPTGNPTAQSSLEPSSQSSLEPSSQSSLEPSSQSSLEPSSQSSVESSSKTANQQPATQTSTPVQLAISGLAGMASAPLFGSAVTTGFLEPAAFAATAFFTSNPTALFYGTTLLSGGVLLPMAAVGAGAVIGSFVDADAKNSSPENRRLRGDSKNDNTSSGLKEKTWSQNLEANLATVATGSFLATKAMRHLATKKSNISPFLALLLVEEDIHQNSERGIDDVTQKIDHHLEYLSRHCLGYSAETVSLQSALKNSLTDILHSSKGDFIEKISKKLVGKDEDRGVTTLKSLKKLISDERALSGSNFFSVDFESRLALDQSGYDPKNPHQLSIKIDGFLKEDHKEIRLGTTPFNSHFTDLHACEYNILALASQFIEIKNGRVPKSSSSLSSGENVITVEFIDTEKAEDIDSTKPLTSGEPKLENGIAKEIDSSISLNSTERIMEAEIGSILSTISALATNSSDSAAEEKTTSPNVAAVGGGQQRRPTSTPQTRGSAMPLVPHDDTIEFTL